MRSTGYRPNGSSRSTRRLGSARSCGSRSMSGCSTQSTSPVRRAAAAVAASGITRHSTWSISARLPPAVALGGSLRGT